MDMGMDMDTCLGICRSHLSSLRFTPPLHHLSQDFVCVFICISPLASIHFHLIVPLCSLSFQALHVPFMFPFFSPSWASGSPSWASGPLSWASESPSWASILGLHPGPPGLPLGPLGFPSWASWASWPWKPRGSGRRPRGEAKMTKSDAQRPRLEAN